MTMVTPKRSTLLLTATLPYMTIERLRSETPSLLQRDGKGEALVVTNFLS